jgi:hypothetical protein
MTADKRDPQRFLDEATDAVRGATETVQATSERIAAAIEAGRRPGGVLGQITQGTRQAPLASLAVAFLAGLMIVRRR